MEDWCSIELLADSKQYLEPFNFVDLCLIELKEIELFVN